MIHYTPANQLTLEGFEHPFDRELDPSNRWVVLAGSMLLTMWSLSAVKILNQIEKGYIGKLDRGYLLRNEPGKHDEGMEYRCKCKMRVVSATDGCKPTIFVLFSTG